MTEKEKVSTKGKENLQVDVAWFGCDILSRQQILGLKRYLIKHRKFVENGQITFLDKVPNAIFEALSRDHRDDNAYTEYRTLACDTLAVWFSRATQLVNSQGEKAPYYAKQLGRFVDSKRADELFHYVIDFWTDSGSALGNAMKEMFTKLITFITVTKDSEFRKGILQRWTLETLEIPYSMRVFYFMIEQLYKEVEPADFILQHRPTFIRDSLQYIWTNSLSTNVGKAIVMVLQNIYDEEDGDDEWLSRWSEDVISSLQNPNLREGTETYLLPQLFSVCKGAVRKFLKQVNDLGDVSILLSCLTVAQNSSVIVEPFDGENPILPLDQVESLLIQENEYLKVTAFSLLVTSPKLASPIKPYLYKVIDSCLNSLFSEMNVQTRNKMFSLLKKFISRVRDSTYRLERDCRKMEAKQAVELVPLIQAKTTEIELGKQFVKRLFDFSLFNLKPGSSHQRKAFSFMTILALIHSGLDSRVEEAHHDKFKIVHYPFHLDIYSPYLIRVMLDNISDDYQDNRNDAITVLSISPLPVPAADIELASSRAMELLADMKGKSVDSGARFFRFLFQHYQDAGDLESCRDLLKRLDSRLIEGLAFAKEDLASACFRYSIQGFFAAFRLILEIIDFRVFGSSLDEMLQRLIGQASDAWEITREVLQHDSPEGNLPEEIESNYSPELEVKYGKGTQVISSYAWRTLKESTGMLGSAINNAPLTDTQILNVGSLLMQQLATIRHRGAFSSVYPTFISCCIKCQNMESLRHITKEWLDSNVALITAKSNFITRRSAGLPYLIAAILTSKPDLVESTLDKLMKIAEQPADADQTMENVNLPQVNAFNCMRTIFIDRALSQQSVLYVDKGMELALKSFESPIWAIRNCAVMLFTALENRMFSSKKLRNNFLPTYPAKLFFTKFDFIKDTFLNNLQDAVATGLSDARQVERIFPILTIMGRLDPTPNYNNLNEFRPMILECLHCRQWKVREMAARSLPALLSSHQALVDELAERLATVDASAENMNMVHGALLASKELLIRLEEGLFGWLRGASSVDKTAIGMASIVKKMVLQKAQEILLLRSYSVQLEYFKLLATFDHLNGYEDQLCLLRDWLAKNCQLGSKLDGAKELAVSEVGQLLLKHSLKVSPGSLDLKQILHTCLRSPLYEVQVGALKFCERNDDKLNNKLISFVADEIWELVKLPVWNYVKALALKLLNQLLVKKSLSSKENVANSLAKIQLLLSLCPPGGNKFLKLAATEALGPLVGESLQRDQVGVEPFFKQWLSIVRQLVDDNLEFPERSAALNSLIGFDRNYVGSKQAGYQKIEVVATLFRFLSDDDHELRAIASEHLSTAVLGLDFVLVPAMAEDRMVDWFAALMKSHPELTELLFNPSSFLFFDYNRRLEDLFAEDLLLFSFEKQNLYRDEINRSDQLNEILLSLGPACRENQGIDRFSASIQRNVEDITDWILQTKPVDGCFGWSLDEVKMEFVYENLKGLSTLIKIEVCPGDSELVKKVKRAFADESLQLHPLLVETAEQLQSLPL
ncbi:DEKNAAC102023 [Brettanomyces naardenensis]|uniref:DEKNAAC102023 n=1 Tax=Brettanomyces naardenensis TaxID=13370 RepID=A0A448YJ90_BRENA|nr:DEKNAAC102023 [Brettanomyces naardenensis]